MAINPIIDIPMLYHELVIFSHIPKTAGTSIRHIIEKNYPSESFCYCYSDNPQKKSIKDIVTELSNTLESEDIEKNLVKTRVLVGHIGFGLHDLLPPRPYKYITLLRDPVERVISYYSHLRKYFKDNLGNIARQQSLKDFVNNRFSIEVDNWQTRYISGLGWQGSGLTNGVNIEYGACSSNMLELAKRNLRQYYIFGLQDKFDESISIFSQYMGWTSIPKIKVNVNQDRKNKFELDRETLNIIVEHNQLDYELYHYAENLFLSGNLYQTCRAKLKHNLEDF